MAPSPLPPTKASIESFFDLLNKYSPAASWITSAFALALSLFAILNGNKISDENSNREDARATLYFEGTPPSGDCTDEKALETILGCKISLKPSDPRIRVLEAVVQFPASEFPDGFRTYAGTYGAPEISIQSRAGFLSNRLRKINRTDDFKTPTQGVIPITIFSRYIYDGKHYSSNSAYFLYYVVFRNNDKLIAKPYGITYCGKLDMVSTFLIDPWVPTTFGFSDKRSSALLFDCLDKAIWMELDRGRYTIMSEPAQIIQRDGKSPIGSWPADVRHFEKKAEGEASYLRVQSRPLT